MLFFSLAEFTVIVILLLEPLGALGALTDEENPDGTDRAKGQCVEYVAVEKLIRILCKSVRLTDIYNNLSNPSILNFEGSNNASINYKHGPKVWILNSGILIEKNNSLIIDSGDTSWLKIIATPTRQTNLKSPDFSDEDFDSDEMVLSNSSDLRENIHNIQNVSYFSKVENGTVFVSKHNGDNPNGIHVRGSLVIDSVKITSWDPEQKRVIDFNFGKRPGEEDTKSKYDTVEPRAFIRVSKDATGTTNITNSEIAYLGYSCSRCTGLSYYGGEGSVIKNSDIHHLLKGYYSKNMGHMLIEGNKFHDNYLYGIDPHTSSHDIVIRNNRVYDNNASGIICSKDCYNLLIEGNEVYQNGGVGRGIAFSINTTNTIARNNNLHDNERCFSFNRESNNNQIYNNTISNCNIGIYLANTSMNSIKDNTITHSESGILIEQDTSNDIKNNKIDSTKTGILFINKNTNNTNNTNLSTTLLIEPDIYSYLKDVLLSNHLINVTNHSLISIEKNNSTVDSLQP